MLEITNEIIDYLKNKDWDKLNPDTIAKSTVIQAAELLEFFQTNIDLDKIKADQQKIQKLKHDLATIIINCMEICTIMEFNSNDVLHSAIRSEYSKSQSSVSSTGKPFLYGNQNPKDNQAQNSNIPTIKPKDAIKNSEFLSSPKSPNSYQKVQVQTNPINHKKVRKFV